MIHQNLIVPFIQNNWIWIAFFFTLIGYYFFFEFQNIFYRKYMVSPQKLVHLINKESAQILDLRPKKFFDDAHIADAINMDIQTLLKNQEPDNLIPFAKDKPIVLFSGYESDGRKVLNIIKKQNFEKIYILSGGALEWKRLNYPFVSSNPSKKSKSKKISSDKTSSKNLDQAQPSETSEKKSEKKVAPTKVSKATLKRENASHNPEKKSLPHAKD
jgi:rhodanese-related sulfurtransferase